MGGMNTPNEKKIQYSCAICMVMILLSSCSTSDEQYAQWNGEPTLLDAGPDREPAPEAEEVSVQESDVITGDRTLEPLVVASPKPVEVSPQAEPVEKKRFSLYGRKGSKKSIEDDKPSYADPVARDEHVTPVSVEPAEVIEPEPIVVEHLTKPAVKKKSAGDFNDWLRNRN